jgi:hypothetical protein
MWANCESFAWEKGTNDRSSALVPASYSRFLSQQVAATAGGAEKIISFIFCGLVEDPSSPYQLGQPHWSQEFYENYMSWLAGSSYWKAAEYGMCYGSRADGIVTSEDPSDKGWTVYGPGNHNVAVKTDGKVSSVVLRLLNSAKDGIAPPEKVFLYACDRPDGKDARLLGVKDTPYWPNNRHDAYIDTVLFEFDEIRTPYLMLVFTSGSKVYLDTILL